MAKPTQTFPKLNSKERALLRAIENAPKRREQQGLIRVCLSNNGCETRALLERLRRSIPVSYIMYEGPGELPPSANPHDHRPAAVTNGFVLGLEESDFKTLNIKPRNLTAGGQHVPSAVSANTMTERWR
jgi:hypothetical protein